MNRTFKEAVWILAISAIAVVLVAIFHPRAPAWFLVEESGRWDIRVEDIGEVLGPEADKIVWIDSRKEAAYAKSHVDGAILINPEGWGDQVAENQDRLQEALGRPVIVYCDGRGCERSKTVAERLRQLIGFERVFVLRGNWRDY